MLEQTSKNKSYSNTRPNSTNLRSTISKEVTGIILTWNYVRVSNLMWHVMVTMINLNFSSDKNRILISGRFIPNLVPYFTERGHKKGMYFSIFDYLYIFSRDIRKYCREKGDVRYRTRPRVGEIFQDFWWYGGSTEGTVKSRITRTGVKFSEVGGPY